MLPPEVLVQQNTMRKSNAADITLFIDLKTVSMLGYLHYQQSDSVLVVTRYNFSTITGLYAISPPPPSPPMIPFFESQS